MFILKAMDRSKLFHYLVDKKKNEECYIEQSNNKKTGILIERGIST